MSIKNSQYPILKIQNKKDLAKRISDDNFPTKNALNLINDVQINFNKYWHDDKYHSEPEKEKYVRSCKYSPHKYTPLGKLLKLINQRILAPQDKLIPSFIFGGISGKNHIQAAHNLLGHKKKRTLLKLDLHRFFEQNTNKRVSYFFKKCECSDDISNLLSDLFCVPKCPKNSKSEELLLARGFATSPRLALWCNLNIFLKINRETRKFLKNKDPRISIYVDDIGISASRVDRETMNLLSEKIEDIIKNYDKNQLLQINSKKKSEDHIMLYSDKKGIEHLGLKIGRNKITEGDKAKLKEKNINRKLKNCKNSEEKRNLIVRKKAYKNYKHYIKSQNYST